MPTSQDLRAAQGLSQHAGDGGRRADRMAARHHDPERARRRAETALQAARPLPAHELSTGRAVQFDLWQPDYLIPLDHDQFDKLWVVTAVSGYSRFMAAWMVSSRAAYDVLWGMLRCFEQLGGVPRTIVWDGEGCIGQWRRGKEVFTDDFQAFRGTLGAGARLCKPNDPEAKGVNERGNRHYETSFLPGRRFCDHGDFNDQITTWLKRANRRVHAMTRRVPAEMIYEDRGAMLAFPPVLPDPSFRCRTRLGRDFYVRVDTTTIQSTRATLAGSSMCGPISRPSWSPATASRSPGTSAATRPMRATLMRPMP